MPLKAIEILNVIVAQKLKKRVEEIPLSRSLKDLSECKSTRQNEILGDLQVAFTSAPEKGEELPLEELGSALGVGFSGLWASIRQAWWGALSAAKCPADSTCRQSRPIYRKRGV